MALNDLQRKLFKLGRCFGVGRYGSAELAAHDRLPEAQSNDFSICYNSQSEIELMNFLWFLPSPARNNRQKEDHGASCELNSEWLEP